MRRVGIIVAGSAYPMDGFKSGLRDLGWVEGKNISLQVRAAEGQLNLLAKFAAEMVSLPVDMIAVIGAVTVRAVCQATSSIPVVFAVVVEPIGDGLARNLERPGGNVTGVTTFDPRQATAQLEFLRAVNPDLERVAILSDLGVSDCLSTSNREAACSLSVEPQVIRVEAPYADNIFRGTHPCDLPIKAALGHELAVNLQTARRLGITVPDEILAKANQVLQ